MYTLLLVAGLVAIQASDPKQSHPPAVIVDKSVEQPRTADADNSLGRSQDRVSLKATSANLYSCPEREGAEIVVCGRRDNDRYRLKPLPDQYGDRTGFGKTFDREILPGVRVHGLGLRFSF